METVNACCAGSAFVSCGAATARACGVFQFAGMKVSDAGDTVISELLAVGVTTTFAVGSLVRSTLMEAWLPSVMRTTAVDNRTVATSLSYSDTTTLADGKNGAASYSSAEDAWLMVCDSVAVTRDSARSSAVPVSVTVCALAQFAVVNVSDVAERPTCAGVSFAMATTTFPVGCVFSLAVYWAVPPSTKDRVGVDSTTPFCVISCTEATTVFPSRNGAES